MTLKRVMSDFVYQANPLASLWPTSFATTIQFREGYRNEKATLDRPNFLFHGERRENRQDAHESHWSKGLLPCPFSSEPCILKKLVGPHP